MSNILEGSLELDGKSTIVQIRVLLDGAHLSFSVSGSLSLVDYFSSGGKGYNSTVSVQTTEGRLDIPVASSVVDLTHDTITLSVPSSERHILNNITAGTRFIFALHRPEKDQ